MPTRMRNGHPSTVSPPVAREHGRHLPAVAMLRARPEPGDLVHRYAIAQVERALAHALKDRPRYRTAKRRAERTRRELLHEPDGVAQVRAVNVALTADGGAAIRTAAKAHVDARPYAVQAAVTLLQLVREHDFRSTAGLSYAGSAASWMALERLLVDRAFARGFEILSTSRTQREGDATASATGSAAGDLLKLAATAAQASRHALGWALHVEQQAREVEPRTPGSGDAWTPSMRAAIEQRRKRESAKDEAGEPTGITTAPDHAPASEDAPYRNVDGGNHNDEPTRRTRVDDEPDEQKSTFGPTRIDPLVVARVEGERATRAATAVARVLVADGVVGPAGSGDPLAPPIRTSKPAALCPHGLGVASCPECWKTSTQAGLAVGRRRIREDQR